MDLTAIGQRCLPRWAVAALRGATSALVLLSPGQGAYLRQQEGVGRHWWSRTREAVIPNGIEVRPLPTASDKARARRLLGLSPDEFVVGIVARLTAQKAHHVLFDAFDRLARSQPNARLVVVGGGERAQELSELATRLGIADRVLFTGLRRDVPTLWAAFDVACLSSVHEGVPITAIEAMAAGLPVVATNCGGLPELITDGEQGFIVPVGDSAALARRLLTLADDPEVRSRQGRAARERVTGSHTVQHTARGYETLLLGLLGRQR
jgi:glycosyltransferase involved in cell wall biosynthesis